MKQQVEFRKKRPGKFWEYIREYSEQGKSGILFALFGEQPGYDIFYHNDLEQAIADKRIVPDQPDKEIRIAIVKDRFKNAGYRVD